MMTPPLPIPSFVDFSKAGEIWQERADVVAQAAERASKLYNILPADKDTHKIAMFGIDCQIGFISPGASLQVPGALEDMINGCHFLYQNLAKITRLFFSLDTHSPYQVFHPAFWRDKEGRHIAPFTPITTGDIDLGLYSPTRQTDAMREYVHQLESSGKYALMIWPYHCLLGGISHALVPIVMEAALFHSFCRDIPPHFESKGQHPLTENYSVLEPEVKTLGGQEVGHFNQHLFDELLQYDRIYVWGEASSHCVMSTLQSLAHQIQHQCPDKIGRIFILEDCMSPVPASPGGPDFPKIARDFLDECSHLGMHLVRSTDPIAL